MIRSYQNMPHWLADEDQSLINHAPEGNYTTGLQYAPNIKEAIEFKK